MEKLARIFDKAIILLGNNGYTEGSWTDLYVNRFISLYGHPKNNIPGEDCYKAEITGEFTITEPTTIEDAGFAATGPTAIEDAEMVPKVASLVK